MRIGVFTVCALLPSMLLFGCQRNNSSSLQAGQVVATVNGHDITVSELDAEMSGRIFVDSVERKHFEQAALQALIARTILADIARGQKLDQQPSYILQQHRANELLLSQNLQREIAGQVLPPTPDEIDHYIVVHPEFFANRQIYALDQLKFRAPADVAQLTPFGPLKTLAEVEQKLIESRTPYQKAPVSLDVLASEPEVVTTIAKLPAGEVFLVPKGDVIFASVITGRRTEPLIGPKARSYAQSALQNQRVEAATVKQLDAQIKAARATVKYQSGFAPTQTAAK